MSEDDSCEVCGHDFLCHWYTGEMDDVTPPAYRPSMPKCDECYVLREDRNDMGFNHTFIVRSEDAAI